MLRKLLICIMSIVTGKLALEIYRKGRCQHENTSDRRRHNRYIDISHCWAARKEGTQTKTD